MTCNVSAMGNLGKHEVKCLLMDGVIETKIVKTLGRKARSNSGSHENLSVNQYCQLPLDLNTEPCEEELLDEPQFYFPFSMDENQLNGANFTTEGKIITSDDVIAEINKFSKKVTVTLIACPTFLFCVREPSRKS
ncbi:hypothetical protein R1sor_022055 [Riccia sorocarpa]|uniref:Uncharacterized protein n=1 Tax=Riccia sorocarpa TaxID=122646 RepID=A0ABD3GPK8_9MARC